MDNLIRIVISIESTLRPAWSIHRRCTWFSINLKMGGDNFHREDFNVYKPYTSNAQYRYAHYLQIKRWIKHLI